MKRILWYTRCIYYIHDYDKVGKSIGQFFPKLGNQSQNISAVEKGQRRVGFPGSSTIKNWLNCETQADYPHQTPPAMPKLKNPEIEKLECYEGGASESFWRKFPRRELPVKVKTKVNVLALRKNVLKWKHKMAKTELRRAKKILKDLQHGAEAYQKSDLPPITTRNSSSAYENGEILTDTIGTWIKKGFVAGPFETPPMNGFRTNPLAAVVRNNKVRPVLNMSGPKGESFNDNVDKLKLERLHMGTAKQFSYLLRNAGKGAKFSKFDIQDAYKLVPAKTGDYRLQGFQWLGRYFVELMMSFGGMPSPCNFDRLGKTKDLLVCLASGTPKSWVPRALDDSPCVSPEGSGVVEKFTTEMKRLCHEINIPLAENCPNADKAFELQTRGTVLGVGFNSLDMSWFLSPEKADKVIGRCMDAANASHMSLKQTQKLMGSVNDLTQMCPLLCPYKRSGNVFLTQFGGNDNIVKMVPDKVKEDMRLIAKVAEDSKAGLPIAEKPGKPGLAAWSFYTDAAGASFSLKNGQKVFHNNEGKGVACIGGSCYEDVWGWSRISWPDGLLTETTDSRGRLFGCKSTTLESVGLLLPLLAFRDLVKGKEIVFKIDNIAVMWGWQNGYVKQDEAASEVLKAVKYLAGFLGTTIHVEHVHRMSDDLASLADEMSRREVCRSQKGIKALENAHFSPVSGFLLEWLRNPNMDLSRGIVNEMLK